MNMSIPSDEDLTADIDIFLRREWLLLLNAPLTPGECLRQARLLSRTQQTTRELVDALDRPDLTAPMRDKYLDYRKYAKANLLGALRNVKSLDLRMQYLGAVRKNAADVASQIRAAGDDVAKARKLAQDAVDFRNSTRQTMQAQYARESAKLVSDAFKATRVRLNNWLNIPQPDKRSLDYLVKAVDNGGNYEKLAPKEQIKVLAGVAERSGKGNLLSTAWKTYQGVATPVQVTIELLVLTQDLMQARDPYRAIASSAVRVGAAAAVTTATEMAIVGVTGALALGTGVGVVLLAVGGIAANGYLNDWINTTVMGIYDDFNPRIAAVMRDLSWEPQAFSTGMEEPVDSLAMVDDFKSSMI